MRKLKSELFFIVTAITLFTACTDNNTGPTGDDRDNFTGSWTCTENSKINGSTTFTVNISKSGSNDEVAIQNFYGLGSNFSATALISGNSMTIPFQTISGLTVQGTGIKSTNSKINLTYYATVGSDKDTVTATYSK